MDADDKGQGTPPLLELGNKPRAPPVAKKPKPVPPKKPALPSKPVIKKNEAQNGEGHSPPQKPIPEAQEPDKAQSPPAPPHKPTPQLPTTPPRAAKPNRTPPPLPKNPPRATKSTTPTKTTSNKGSDNVNNSDDGETGKASSDTVCVDKTALVGKDDSASIETLSKWSQSAGTTSFDSNSRPDVKNIELNHSQMGAAANDSNKSPPKVPLKPKPRLDKTLKEKESHLSNECLLNNTTNKGGKMDTVQQGNSTRFVSDTGGKSNLTDSLVTNNASDNITAPPHILKGTNSPSPKHSPKVPHKPLPKLPNKSSNKIAGATTDDKQEVVTNTMSVHYTRHDGAVIHSDNNQTVDATFPQSAIPNTNSDKTVSCESLVISDTSKGSSEGIKPQPLPKPVPRRSIPATGRPMPIPRKRLSVNRLSGTEDSFSPGPLMTSSVHNLSMETESPNNEKEFLNARDGMMKAKSEENVCSAVNEWNVVTPTIEIGELPTSGDKNKDNRPDGNTTCNIGGKSPVESPIKLSDKGTVVNSFVKSRVVFSEKGEEKQYRVIDKSVVTQANSAESQNNSTSSVLQKKNGEAVSKKLVKDLNSYSDSDKSQKGVDGNSEQFDDLLMDKSILEPSSLLNEIEEILSRSHKHLSLTRSGLSPEKKRSPLLALKNESNRCERSRSVDSYKTGMPVRPPRPKKEQKRVRAQSQVMYDSCGSDTESLPDTSHCANDNLTPRDTRSMTLGRAKPHPPKPKRHKLLKVQRSQSDITTMKAFVDKQGHKRHTSDGSPMTITDQGEGDNSDGGVISPLRPKSWRKSRATKKAPPPPPVSPYKGSPTNINTVVPLHKPTDGQHRKSKKGKTISVEDSFGSVYHSIQYGEGNDSSEGDHDYHEIPEEMDKNLNILKQTSLTKYGQMTKIDDEPGDRSGFRPKLPPRNQNNSMSFETSSLSSMGQENDSVITGDGCSSVEDMSISSCQRSFPKTSSPNVKVTVDDLETVPRGSPVSGNHGRPASGVSIQSDSGSGSHVTEHVSFTDSEDEDEQKASNKRDRKLFMIVKEIASSEAVFVDVLKLLNVDFRKHISDTTEKLGRPVIPSDTLNRILDYLPQLQNFNEDLLKDLENRINQWEEQKGIADIFIKKGPFLKLYSSYIRDFETMTSTYDEALKKYPAFQTAVKEYELSPKCASLALKHYMLKPIQRIPQYRLLLQDYKKHLPEDSVEMKETQTALAIVSEVAHHANENMRHGDYVQKMLEIQRSLIGQFEVIKPGRTFLKEGELMKLSRKEMQPRFFFLFNDVLLYTTPVATGYRLNNVLPLAGMKVSVSGQDEFKTEFSIISVQRSFTLHSSTLEERDDWVTALNSAIDENAQKRNTFEAVRAGAQNALEIYSDWETFKVMLDKDFVLGCKAPLWIPDARVTMCMLCTCEFTVTWRRHHCRACGRVVCGNCSDCKAPLRYLKYKPARVCDECFKNLKQDAEKEDSAEMADHLSNDPEESSSFLSLKNGILERFQKIRRSGRSEKKNFFSRPTRLVEVNANDEGASMSGYLNRWQKGKKWKRSWYLVKDKVLYTFKATQDTAAAESMVLLGYEVSRFTDYFEGIEPDLLFQLSHSNQSPIVFRTDSATATERWVTVMRESSVT